MDLGKKLTSGRRWYASRQTSFDRMPRLGRRSAVRDTSDVVARTFSGRSDQLLEKEADMKLATSHISTRHLPLKVDVCLADRLDHWCRTFGVTRLQLCSAVTAVGSNSDLVRRHLRCATPVSLTR